MLPNEEGEIWHNAFYDDISSNNIENLNKLIKKWPHNLEELDEVLAKAYGELKLKNVWLENETEIFVENKLINLRFFSDTSRRDQIISNVDGQLIITKALQLIDQHLKCTLEFSKLFNNTRERIELTVECIRLLETDYLNLKVDGKFIFLAKFIAKNIHVLKQQLKSTHDRLPWEQMEFCLVSFIASYTNRQELNLYCIASLNKRRILHHLEDFADSLEAQKGKLLSSKHEQEVTKIINGYPRFEELYKDNQQIREVQSLVKISDHIKSKVLTANPEKRDGQLIIAKALKLIGEYLKSIWEFSKLFNSTTTRVDLRNSLSLLYERIRTKKSGDLHFSLNIQKHIGLVGDVIARKLNEINTNESDIFDNNTLISLQSFFTIYEEDPNVDDAKKTLIQLILQSVSLLREDCSNMEKVDKSFIFTIKSIERNIIRIERQSKSNCEKLPWQEMKFCLGSFVASYTKNQEMNPFYRALLNKSRMLSHLEHFAKKLEDENTETDEQVGTMGDFRKFYLLYKDYQQIRDIHSLRKINDHIELTLSGNPNEEIEPLIITRVLQVMGEHLKNTLESPNLSDTIGKRLVLSLPKTARRIIIELRDLLSHDDNDALSKRMKIEKKRDDFFCNVKNDLKKVGDVITDILYTNEMEIIGLFLWEIAGSTSDEIKEVAEMLNAVQLEKKVGLENFNIMEDDHQLEKLLKKVSDSIPDKTDFEEDIFNQIKSEIKCAGSRLKNFRSDYVKGIKILQSLGGNLALIDHESPRFEVIIMQAIEALANITYSKIDRGRWKKISDLLTIFLKIIWLRRPYYNFDFDEVIRSITEICYIAKFETGNIKWIEKFREMLIGKACKKKHNRNNESQIYNVSEEEYKIQLAGKLSDLDNILVENTEKLYKMDKKMHAVVDMLVLDIMAILDNSMENNLLLLDDNVPLLNGRCLRNHLAHNNALFDVLLSDPAMAVILNAKKFTEENIIESQKKIGMLIKDDILKLREKFNRDLLIISNQERMFVALEEGNLTVLEDCLKKGADVNARSINSWTTLHFATKGPSLKVVKFILNKKISYYPDDCNGQSPLHIAAAHGRKSIVEFLVKMKHLDVDDLNNRGETPLHLAARNGHKNTVKVLLKNKANTFTQDLRGYSPVHYAIWNNHTEVAKILLEKDINVDKTIDGYTPLHISADCGNLQLVTFLLKSNVRINAKSYNDITPLHLAALNSHLKVVNALIAKGADVNARELHNLTPLNYAIEKDHEEISNLLLKRTNNVNAFDKTYRNSLLHYAANYGRLEIVKALLKKGAAVNFPNIENKTPLHFAAGIGHSEICNVFLEHGGIVNARDNSNNTPLHCAADKGHIRAVEFLIDKGADFNAKRSDGKTPLHIAVLQSEQRRYHPSSTLIRARPGRGLARINVLLGQVLGCGGKGQNVREIDISNEQPLHIPVLQGDRRSAIPKISKNVTPRKFAAVKGRNDLVDLLITKNRANVNASTNCGMTPLHEAALRGHKIAIDLLIKNNAEINASATNGLTPLEAAVIGDYSDVVNILIENGAQVDKIGMSQSTPLHLASEFGHKEIVEILLKNGSDVNIINFHRETPVIAAIRYHHKRIVKFLIKAGAKVTVDALKEAISTGHTNIVKILLLTQKDIVNMPIYFTPLYLDGDKGDPVTPLYFAAQNGYEEVVKILIARGAAVNLKFNSAPLHVAAAMGHSNVVNVLLQNQADINVKDENNATPLELAVKNGHLQVVKMILHDKNATGINGNALLHIASEQGHLEMVEYLVDEGYDIQGIPVTVENL